MNRENVLKAIAVMERAAERDSVDMSNWQVQNFSFVLADTESQLHHCGNTACFAGHIAISPEFQEDGGMRMINSGAPIYKGESAESAIASWLEIDLLIAKHFVFGNRLENSTHSYFYDKEWSSVNGFDVVNKLKQLLIGEL